MMVRADRLKLPLALAVTMGLLTVLTVSFARAESEDQRFLDGLRQRRLFSLAERFCQQRLADNSLSDQQRAELVIEQIRTAAAHAINSPPLERDALWDTALAAAEQFRGQFPTHSRLVLIRVQEALTLLARGELLRQEAEVGAGSADAQDQARTQIRQAAAQLEEIADELTREIPLRSRTPREDELSAGELRSLQNNVYFHLARAYRNQGLLYGPGSDDRVGSLNRALGALEQLRQQLPPGDPLLYRLMLDKLVCLRLMENASAAQETLQALSASSEAPPEIQLAARAEEARLALAGSRHDAALAVLNRGRTIDGTTSPELDLALLDAYLAKWREAAESKDEAMSRQWQQKAVAVVRLIEQEHGPYWGRRGDLLLVRTAERGSGGADLEIMVRTADNFYLQKQYDEAIDAYDKAAQKALAAQDPKRAFELLYKAAAVAHLLKRHDAASRRLRDLAIKLPADTRAAEAHRLAAWNASQAVVQANDAALLPPYIALLEEHLEKFPDSPTCNQVRQWLGDIRKGQRQWSDALQAYLRVSPDSPYYASAVQSAAQCAAAWFEELKTQGVPYEEQAESAAANFEKLVAGGDGQLPAAWDDASRLAAVTAARIRLQHTSAGRAEAAKLLEAALAGSPEAPAAWKTDATALLVVALAAQEHRRQEAMQRLSDLADGEPKQLLEMLKGLATTADSASPQSRSQMAGLLLDAAGLLAPHRSELDDAGRYALARVEAEALAQLGRRDEAQAVYEALVREYPKDARVLRGYAGFLLQATDAASLSKALDQWRMLAAQPGTAHTDAWYEAKYSVALALSKLGRKDEAVQLIRYLQVTPPGLEKTSRRADFLRLLAECSAAK